MSSITQDADELEEIAGTLLVQASAIRAAKIRGELERRQVEMRSKRKFKASNPCNKRPKITVIETFQDFHKQFTNGKQASTRYFYVLSKNSIIDTTNTSKNSHMQLLPQTLKQKISHTGSRSIMNSVVTPINKILAKTTSLKEKLKLIKKMKPSNNAERIQQEVTRFILDIHVHKYYMLSSNSTIHYSEEDFKIKFWSHILEELFSTATARLHWEDTVPIAFSNSMVSPKVDIRMLPSFGSNEKDCGLGEFAKAAVGTKLYNDKLKLALIIKKHINESVKKGVYVKYPFIVIMGFDFKVMTMELVKDVGYVMKTDSECCFPVTRDSLRNQQGIEAVINCINRVKTLVNIVNNAHEEKKKEQRTNKTKKIDHPDNNQDSSDYKITPVYRLRDDQDPIELEEDEDQDNEEEEQNNEEQQEEENQVDQQKKKQDVSDSTDIENSEEDYYDSDDNDRL